jgi:hypothetical protein
MAKKIMGLEVYGAPSTNEKIQDFNKRAVGFFGKVRSGAQNFASKVNAFAKSEKVQKAKKGFVAFMDKTNKNMQAQEAHEKKRKNPFESEFFKF